MTESQDVEQESDWRVPYVAGAFDWSGTLVAKVVAEEGYRLGHGLVFEVRFTKSNEMAIGMLDEFCMDYGMNPKIRDEASRRGDTENTRDRYTISISRREDVWRFLEVVGPFLIVRHEEAVIMLDQIRPLVEDGRHRNKEGFIEVMEHIEELRETGSQRGYGSHKYDLEYFLDEWDIQ